MPSSLLPSLFLAILTIGYSPGPANIYSLSCVLANGREKAMKAWLGLLSGFCTAALIATTVTHFAGIALGEYVKYLRYIGAIYILYLAWKMLKAGIKADNDTPCSFASGFMVQFTNAKMILFELTAFSTYVLPYSSRYIDLLYVAALLLIAGPIANLVWLLAGSFLHPLIKKHQKPVNIISAIALLICAIMIITK